MEIIKIGSDSFKISLSDAEAEKYKITKDPSCNSKLSESVKSVLELAKKREGIDFGEDRMITEIYLSKDGGCEIFVSKATRVKSQTGISRQIKAQATYRFENIESLLGACKRLKDISCEGDCTVYYNKSTGSYYLTLFGIYPKDIKYAFLSEYAERVKNNLVPYIEEYCDCICQNNTLKIFSKLL